MGRMLRFRAALLHPALVLASGNPFSYSLWISVPKTLIFYVPLVPPVVVVVPVSKNILPVNNMVRIDSLAPVVGNASIHCASPLMELACSGQEDFEGSNKEVALNLSPMHGGDLKLIVSHVVGEKDHTPGSCHDNFDVVNMGLCDVNTMMVNDSSSGLVISSGVSPLATLEPAFPPIIMGPKVNVTIIDVHVSLISHEALNAQLALKLIDTSMDNFDWMDKTFSSASGGAREDIDELVDENLELYSLKVGRIVGKSFSHGGGKHRKRKSKKK
ncbi:hypothetical protein M5K25_004896 [Dendrobium thyrsiflorum]|uniref:Uncharacterized protein n=1 Tax=Dendrobium thyrsiflorum TaxID=117978 RepID=A0ABD0VHH0_DENTH